MEKYRRIGIIIGVILVQSCVGTIYTWSLFNYPLMDEFGWSENEVVLTFSIATFIFAFSTILAGRLLDKFGPRIVISLGGLFYGGGLMLVSQASSLVELYLFYGVIAGMGVGFVYVCPISISMKWFPNHKGIVTGIAVGAFGSGSLVFKFIIQAIINHHTISQTFLILGITYGILILLGGQLLSNPKVKEVVSSPQELQYGTRQMVKQSQFYFYWILFYLGCIGGLLVIGLALDLGVRIGGLSISMASQSVALIAVFNAGGRILWGYLSDKLQKSHVLMLMFLITGVSLIGLGFLAITSWLFFIFIAAIALCFGGFLSVFPIITEERFGKTYFGSNYGIMYQAYGLAALTGPVLLRMTNQLNNLFVILTLLSGLGILLNYIFHFKDRLSI
jgi:MFS transporter, OFA family, oxalate/formate antiporter